MTRLKLFFFSVLVALSCSAQKPLEFSSVIKAEGLSAQQLYDLTRNWFSRVYVDSKAVIQHENPGNQLTGKGKLVFEGNMMYSSLSGFIGYLIDVQFKDGRMKFTMTDFRHDPSHDAKFNNQMGILMDSIPSDMKTIGIEGANRKACYKYFHKNGVPLCEKQFIKLSKSLEEFVAKREETKDDW